MTHKIALMGISGAGKDFLAKFLIDNFNYTRFSFSDQLKQIASSIYPWLDKDYPSLIKEQPLNKHLNTGEIIELSPREIWLHLNTLRDIEKHIFIRMLSEEIDVHCAQLNNAKVLVTDIRSTDEFNWCKDNGFSVLYIESTKKVYDAYAIDNDILVNKEKADFKFVNRHNGYDDFKQFFMSCIETKSLTSEKDSPNKAN